MGLVFSAMGSVIDFGPSAPRNGVFAKQMQDVTQRFAAGPALMALPMFAGTLVTGPVPAKH